MSDVDVKPSFLESISPWSTSRASTPQPERKPVGERESLKQTQGQDHTTSHRKRLSSLRYPDDCPPLQPRWFYAVDVPKSKPAFLTSERTESKPLPTPKKFVPFVLKDSQSVENAFQTLIKCEDRVNTANSSGSNKPLEISDTTIRVPVNEDYLYDVDVDKRELGPAFWLGPTYEVRRGTWFFQEGSTLKPCEENLAIQIEEGYLRLKPWQAQFLQHKNKTRFSAEDSSKGTSEILDRPTSTADGVEKKYVNEEESTVRDNPSSHSELNSPLPVHRLFGSYMNSTVTYQDSSIAWLNYDDFMSRMSSTVYQRFGGVGGTKLVRGYTEPGRQKDLAEGKGDAKGSMAKTHASAASLEAATIESSEKTEDILETAHENLPGTDEVGKSGSRREANEHRATLQRQMSSLNGETENVAELEEEARRQEEKEMEDSREVDGEERDREIEHLVLVTHGIGQRLGIRLESVNFIHDVNVLRKTMKSVYGASPDLQTLNATYSDSKKNCRVQVLPVCWRHLLDFPRQGLRQNRKEFDLADPVSLSAEDEQYPSLADITLEGVPAVRNLISDLAMDVLLYQSQYREHIIDIVQRECNRIFQVFKTRNPSFKGSVSLCGHSLGSAIMFDILCHHQPHLDKDVGTRDDSSMHSQESKLETLRDYSLEFDCKEFFCLGSPIALFQMLKAKTIAGRRLGGASDSARSIILNNTSLSQSTLEQNSSVSSPRCEELYNIFHPSDPVSYRLEPLISPAMTSLKPQPLPSVKRSIWTASGQSLSNISSRVGTLWTNFTSGVASSLLNRSLGLQTEDKPGQGQLHLHDPHNQSLYDTRNSEDTSAGGRESHTPNVVNSDLETLYEGFEKARYEDTERFSKKDFENRARKVKLEEAKVRALNSNGRVDYSIQEGAFDISLIASLASHLSYWADEDVSHFMLSQMLSRARRKPRQ